MVSLGSRRVAYRATYFVKTPACARSTPQAADDHDSRVLPNLAEAWFRSGSAFAICVSTLAEAMGAEASGYIPTGICEIHAVARVRAASGCA